MFGLRKTLSALFLAVFFLVLASLAMTIYNADQEDKDAMAKSEAVRKSGEAVVSIIDFSSGLAGQSMETNNNFGKKIVEIINYIDWKSLFQKVATSSETGKTEEIKEISDATIAMAGAGTVGSSEFIDKISGAVKNELVESQGLDPAYLNNISLQNVKTEAVNKFVDYQKTNEGAEIIFKTKHGEKYKIPLPFKFLSNSN